MFLQINIGWWQSYFDNVLYDLKSDYIWKFFFNRLHLPLFVKKLRRISTLTPVHLLFVLLMRRLCACNGCVTACVVLLKVILY